MPSGPRGDVLIFGLARSGSTSLARALERQPSISCAYEPFNPDNSQRAINPLPTTTPELTSALAKVFTRHNALKHVWHPSGWPFRQGGALNQHLLVSSCRRVLLITRRNALRRIVSRLLSAQTGVWEVHDRLRAEALLDFPFEPLSRRWIREQLDLEAWGLDQSRSWLRDSGLPSLEIVYEALYAPGSEGRATELRKIISFLGLATSGPPFEAALALLNPARRVSAPALYRRVPGIIEIEREFGSDDRGWLLEDS